MQVGDADDERMWQQADLPAGGAGDMFPVRQYDTKRYATH